MIRPDEIISLLKNEQGNVVGDGNKDLVAKLKRYAYSQEELELIRRQVVLGLKLGEENKKSRSKNGK